MVFQVETGSSTGTLGLLRSNICQDSWSCQVVMFSEIHFFTRSLSWKLRWNFVAPSFFPLFPICYRIMRTFSVTCTNHLHCFWRVQLLRRRHFTNNYRRVYLLRPRAPPETFVLLAWVFRPLALVSLSFKPHALGLGFRPPFQDIGLIFRLEFSGFQGSEFRDNVWGSWIKFCYFGCMVWGQVVCV